MSQENVRLIENAYNSFKTGDLKSLLANFAEDIHWELPKIEGLPISGIRNGREQVQEFFTTLAKLQEPLQFEPREFIAERDKVVSIGFYRWRVKETDKIFESAFAHVFTIRDGKVVRFLEFTDSAASAAAYKA
jgi:ketosteroid isomerase-like protein